MECVKKNTSHQIPNNTNDKSNNIILVCGLPGAGKSSLVRHALEHIPHVLDSKIVVHVIEHDAIYARIAYGATFEAERWRKSREDAIEMVETILKNGGEMNNQLPEATIIIETCIDPHKTISFIVVDDNFYYSSMRRMYYNLARQYNTGFVQVHVVCPLSVCVVRNSTRENAVPEHIIYEMNEKFENPDPNSQNWDKHTICISSHPSWEVFPWAEVLRYCEEPVTLVDDTDEKNANRTINLENLAHQFDLQARKIISAVMAEQASNNKNKQAGMESNNNNGRGSNNNNNKVRVLGKVLSVVKQRHVINIHKLVTKFADAQVLASLLDEFQRDVQDHVCTIINTMNC